MTENASSAFFRTDNLCVGYDGKALIKDINISVDKGQILTLIGPNGAGKSTILKSIIGQLKRIDGGILLEGTDVAKFDRKEFAKKVAVVLTERSKPELLTCEDVVGMGRYPYTGSLGLLTEEDYEIVEWAMDLVHVTELRNRDFTAISDGQRQRILLARAICQEPELLILDEPTSFLDIRYKLEFLAILQELCRTKGMAVLMSLHELDLADRVSSKVVCVKGNSIDRYGPPQEVFTGSYVRDLYGLTVGSYDEGTGRMELPAVQGDPKVFVICGNGTGTSTFRRFQREGIPFAAGILTRNDIDYPVAMSLCQDVVASDAFTVPDESIIAKAKAYVDSCDEVVCCLQEGQIPQPAAELIAYAKSVGKLS